MKCLDLTSWTIIILTVLAAVFFICVEIYADGTLGFNYNRVVDDKNWGVIGDYEYDAGAFDTEIEGAFQSGDIYKGKTDLSITFDVSAIGFRLYSNNTLKGYTLDGLGRTNDIGAALVLPTGDLEIAVGVFGRNGNPFAPRTALGTLTDAGFAETDVEGLGLEGITLSEGISIKEGSTVNVAVETEFDVDRFEIEIKGLFEVLGEGEKAHQFLTNIATDGDLFGEFDWKASVDITGQMLPDVIEYETSWFVGIGYEF